MSATQSSWKWRWVVKTICFSIFSTLWMKMFSNKSRSNSNSRFSSKTTPPSASRVLTDSNRRVKTFQASSLFYPTGPDTAKSSKPLNTRTSRWSTSNWSALQRRQSARLFNSSTLVSKRVWIRWKIDWWTYYFVKKINEVVRVKNPSLLLQI